MRVKGKVCVITGAASGIGKALAERFRQEGAKGLVLGDMQADKLEEVAASVGGLAVVTNVAKEEDIKRLAKAAEDEYGRIDVFVSNAGIARMGGEESSDEDWQANWDIHVMAHVYAARAVLPGMIERGSGYLLQMASAAGLLSQIGDAAYSTTKHAAVGFAESLAITHGRDGIRVSVICPQYVATPLLGYAEPADAPGLLTPEAVADTVVEGIGRETFLILPHPEIARFVAFKSADYDKWLDAMRDLRSKVVDEIGTTDLRQLHKLL